MVARRDTAALFTTLFYKPLEGRLAFPDQIAHKGAMTSQPSTLERAFELARSGECAGTAEIRIRLKQEKYDSVEAHLQGPSISRQLRRLCEEASRGRQPA
jgi:hypothetical protein